MYFCVLLGMVFFYFYLPETRGKTLQEIEDYFSGRISSETFKKKSNANKTGITTINNLAETKPKLVIDMEKPEKNKLLP